MTLWTLLIACTTPQTPAPVATAPNPTVPVDEAPTGELEVVSATVAAGAPVVDSLALAEGLAFALDNRAIADWEEDGDLDVSSFQATCVVPSIVNGELVLAFSACGPLDGTMRLATSIPGPTTITFDDDFSIDGVDLDGSVQADLALLALTFDLDGDVTYGNVALELTLGIDLSAGVAIHGELVYTDPDIDLTVELGTPSDPLTFTLTCRCPDDGIASLDLEAPLNTVDVDLDALVTPFDGSDDYPALEVPIAPLTVPIFAELDFTGACGNPSVTVTSQDVLVVVQTADVQTALDQACLDGEVAPPDCASGTQVLTSLPASVSLPVPLSLVAAGAETSLEASLTAFCPI
ncbi:MAG: hypothetical protein AAF602_08030 [Myxococcota bacterium]